MSKVLQRSMFQKPRHEHRSTGIASGLEYRDGYAVGGRVGFQSGGGQFGQGTVVNPRLFKDTQKDDSFFQFGLSPTPFKSAFNLPGAAESTFPPLSEQLDFFPFTPIEKLARLPAGGGSSIDRFRVPYEETGIGKFFEAQKNRTPMETYEALGIGKPTEEEIAASLQMQAQRQAETSTSPETQPTTYDLMTPKVQRGVRDIRPSGIGEISGQPSPKRDPDSVVGKEEKVDAAIDAVNRADAFAKERRASLNEELAALRAKQDKDNKLLAALNIVSAMNDPNLPQGASRVGAGVQQLTAEAQNALAIKQQRDETDLARKFDIAENDIQRAYAREDYRTQKQIDAEFGEEGTQVKYMNYLLGQMGIESGSDQARDFIKEFVFGKKGQRGTLANTVFEAAGDINTDPGDFRRLYGIPERLDKNGEDLPLDNKDVEAAMDYLDDTVLAGVDFKDGGRVGFSTGGSTTPESKNVPIVMGYDQLKKTLGEIVPDNVIKLISSNPTAFKEFAAIETNQDVENFNNEYDVRFSLPEPAKTEEEVVNVASSPSLNVTAPSAVMANPNIMPMQTGAGQLTPTETAFLSPTEQAIKMRS